MGGSEGETDSIGIRRNPERSDTLLGNRWGGGTGGEAESVGIRRNPDGPTLCLEIVVNQWNLRIFD